jgi:hypothetical protein
MDGMKCSIDRNNSTVVVDGIKDAVTANSDSISFPRANKFFHTLWPRFIFEAFDGFPKSVVMGRGESEEFLLSSFCFLFRR